MPGPKPHPIDEETTLALLREGLSPYAIGRRLRVNERRIKAFAEARGVEWRQRRSPSQAEAARSRFAALRSKGYTVREAAQRLGYRTPTSMPADGIHARRLRSIMRRLRKANRGRADWDDIPSFVRMAGNPRRHWLLRPEEIELARSLRLLPESCMGSSAAELIDRSLHTPPHAAGSLMTHFASNF